MNRQSNVDPASSKLDLKIDSRPTGSVRMPVRSEWSKPLTDSANVIKAIANPLRLRALHLLEQGEICHCHFARALDVPELVLDRHLALLRKRHLVQVVRGKYFTFYRLPAGETPLHARLFDIVKMSLGVQQLFDEDAARLHAVHDQPAGGAVCRSVLHGGSEPVSN
jgi:DNA-binding transcriptional ArsR family regulator